VLWLGQLQGIEKALISGLRLDDHAASKKWAFAPNHLDGKVRSIVQLGQ
jgi:hypothetical protein